MAKCLDCPLSFLFVATSARISLPCSLAHSAADQQKGGTIANAGADRQRQQIEPARPMPFLGKACIFDHYGRGIRWHSRRNQSAGRVTRRSFAQLPGKRRARRSEEHTAELQALMRDTYADF